MGKNVRFLSLSLIQSPSLSQMLALTLFAKISLCEIYKLVPQILRIFHLSLVDGEQEWETHNYWFHKASRVNAKVQVRDSIEGSPGYQLLQRVDSRN